MGAVAAVGVVGAVGQDQRSPVLCEEKKKEEQTEHYPTAKEYWQDNPRSQPGADVPGTNPYGERLYEKKFANFGYGKPIDGDGMFIHSRSIPDTSERNLGSRESYRVKAKDPKKLPKMTLAQVQKLSEVDDKCVATYRGGVYDLSGFLKAHPGGDRILMANGHDLEPFWNVYRLHFRPHIQHLVEDFRIGNLSKKDAKKSKENTRFENGY